MQNIVYSEFLPAVLGERTMEEFDLFPNFYSQYNPQVRT